MATYTLRYATNLAADPLAHPIPAQLAQGDSDAYVFEAQVFDSRDPQETVLAGTVTGSVIRPDGGTVTFLGEKDETTTEIVTPQGTFDATVCRITLPQAALAYPGRVNITVKLIDGSEETTVLNVSAVVVRTDTGTAIDPGEVVPNLAELLALIEDCEDATEAANDAAEAASTAMAGAVRFDQAQTIALSAQRQARDNVGAADANVTGQVIDPVVYWDADRTSSLSGQSMTRTGGDLYTLNSGTVSGNVRFKFSGVLNVTSTSGGQSGWAFETALTAGVAYTIRSTPVSGTITGSPNMYVYVEGDDTNEIAKFKMNGGSATFVWPDSSKKAKITTYIASTVSASNFTFRLTLCKDSVTTIAGSIADVENATATSAHTSGSLLMMGGQLYKATAAIASGDTITPGSSGNVAATSIAALFTPTVGAPTYVNNSYIESANFAYSYTYKYPIGIAIISIRFAVTTALTSTNVKFGELGFGIPTETRVSLANQSGVGSCLVTIGTDGSLYACAQGDSKPSGWGIYNFCITLPTT